LRSALNHGTAPWILTWTAIALTALVLAFATGCSRTVLVGESSPIRIGPETRARVYARVDGEWVLSENRVTIPEGWYCVPPSFVEK
jgi:hypothetical protein